ncbi:ultra-long-chain fatty acid omega-hydroxylase-like [Mercenaria mercenaria]|uniref:ultra-long-chain fatty acid omega-hydroxylase-like n=1 Tax=Mercenaria mercenaria TaxID=6596 RepID=UPI00234F67B8|nr:ultra-long-chain fatty acid omega-hydroxylase-like [Mercenaria mercenaria]
MYLVEMANTYGSEQGYVLLWGIFKKPIVVPCSPKVMGSICKSNEPKSKGLGGSYRFLLPWLGEGLLVANGEKWARNRRLLTPAFHFEILKPYTKVFNQSADILVKKLMMKAECCERFDVFQHISLCTLEVILKCAFSYSKDVQNAGETNPYVKTVNRLTDAVIYRFLRPITFFDTVWNICPVGRQFNKDCEFVHSVAEEIIDKRRETLEQTGSPKSGRYIDFLDILLTARDEEGRGLSRLEIRNEVDTFLFEGYDTTASAISWILYSLAENPECQRKCQAEIDEVLDGRESDDLEWSDLNQLEYLTMCIKEGMRLHSPVPGVSRETTQDFDLGDRVAPEGTIIVINIWILNHMENVWGPDHMEFKPERFSKENIDKIEHFQYVPFSAGPRNCIGQNFALNEEKVVLSKLLRNFTFRLDPNHKVEKSLSGVMRTKDGMYMFAEKREL